MKKIAITLFASLVVAMGASAQSDHPNSKASQEPLGGGDVNILVVNVLSENGINHFNAPGVPRFTIIGKDKSYYLGIGGYAKSTLSYDWGNPLTNPNSFITSAIPFDQPEGNNGLVQFGVGTSNLAINFVALPHTKHQVGIYLNANFAGVNNGPQLQAAYIKYCGFTVGYAPSLFTDVMAGPPTIDYQGPNSWTYLKNSVIDYTYKWGNNWEMGAGLEMPLASYTNGEETYTVHQRIPDIPAYLQYAWNKRNSWVRLSALMRNLYYRDTEAETTRDNVGWGIKLSGSATYEKKFTVYYQALVGKGISNYIQDMNGLRLDMLPDPEEVGRLHNVEAWGGYLGFQYNFTPTVFASATYSMVRTSTPDGKYGAVQYKNAQYVAANIFWNIAPHVQMGVEYLWGEREDASDTTSDDSRLQTMVQVNF